METVFLDKYSNGFARINLLNIQLRIYMQKRYLKSLLVCFLGKRRCTMEIPETLEKKLNAAFVAGLTVFIIVFWFFVIPSA